ncbi:hypothetical protein [Lacrimispora sp.]|uniref:hypothetical protein n=1 Tax=Lacrimispora sp. TaxID=2719234 RepID=UPI00285445CC|nr:hypothetical protein [Lacrimispora sp.]MDR7813382.1 hypothetical protein [Lacrimispora sp.]
MLFDNPIFENWYTDSMSISRNVSYKVGNIDKKRREEIYKDIPCRIYSAKRNGPSMNDTAATATATDKVACDVAVDLKAGDMLMIIRGGLLGSNREPERYFAGLPQPYYDPVGGVLSGLEHQEAVILMDEVIK